MISALIVGASGRREIILRTAVLRATNLDVHTVVVRNGEEAVQILRSIRFELVVVDLRDGEGAAREVLEALGRDRPDDLERVLLVSDVEHAAALRGQARMIEGDPADLEMPNLGRLIARTMRDVVPEMTA